MILSSYPSSIVMTRDCYLFQRSSKMTRLAKKLCDQQNTGLDSSTPSGPMVQVEVQKIARFFTPRQSVLAITEKNGMLARISCKFGLNSGTLAMIRDHRTVQFRELKQDRTIVRWECNEYTWYEHFTICMIPKQILISC